MEKRKTFFSKINMCRFCLENDESELMPIYQNNSLKQVPLELQIISCISVEIRLWSHLRTFDPIESEREPIDLDRLIKKPGASQEPPTERIFPQDALPKLICKSCKGKINQFYIFKKNCKKIHTALKNFVESVELNSPKLSLKRHASSSDLILPIKNAALENTNSIDLVDMHQTKKVKLDDGTEIITLCITSASASNSTLDDSSQGSLPNEYEEIEEMGDEGNEFCILPRQIEKEVFACPQCERTFPLKQLLDLHIFSHQREKQFFCGTCNHSFYTKNDLVVHGRIHSEQSQFCCTICSKVFTRESLLRKHEQAHTDAEKYICIKCDRSFLSNNDLVAHFKRHSRKRPFACKECDKSFVFKQGLERHMMSMHAEDKPHKCNYCDASFGSQIRLTRHITMHAGLRPYPCKICSRTFLLNHHLTRHMRSHYAAGQGNPEEVIGQHKCDLCSMSFRRKDSLINHSAIHSMVNLKCVICNTLFSTAKMVKEHITTHLQGLPFPCENCDYSFETKQQLEEHELKHAEMEYEEQIEQEVISEVKQSMNYDSETECDEDQGITDFHITDIDNPELVPCGYSLKDELESINLDAKSKNSVEKGFEQESIPPIIRSEGVKMYERKGPIHRKFPDNPAHAEFVNTAALEQITEKPNTSSDCLKMLPSKIPLNVKAGDNIVKVQKYIINKDEMKKMAKLGVLEVKNGQVIMKSSGKSIINASMKLVESSDIENLLNKQKLATLLVNTTMSEEENLI